MDAGECFLTSSGQDEKSSWPLDLNLPLCPTATKDTPLLPPNPSPESSSSASSSASAAGGGYRAVSPISSILQPPLVTPSFPKSTYLPKLSSPSQPNFKEENKDGEEALVGHVLFSSDGTVYLLKDEEDALPSPALLRDPQKSTVLPCPPLTSYRITATYQGFCSNQISQHTSAEAAILTESAPSTSPRIQDQPKEKEAGGQTGAKNLSDKPVSESTRTQSVDSTWICLLCQLKFQSGSQLGYHTSHFHALDHPYQDQLASGETSGIIYRSNGQIFLSLLEPKNSHNLLDDGQELENVTLSGDQTAPLLDVTQSTPEQSGTSEDFMKNTNHNETKSQVALQGNLEGSPKLSMGLVPNSPVSYHKCDSTGILNSTEAKDSKAHIDEKNGIANWCSAVTEALGEDGEEEVDDMPEHNLSASQPLDINEQLITNQSFYGPMMTNTFVQMGALHGSDKGGNQTDADRGSLSLDECTPSSGPQPFQSLSLQGQLSLLHSRNSCKTLKCPKCNWHYKYQQTLDVHMKEKHPESHSHCSYCHSGQQHPRLARGESYNCGYKPYRCEACNYSTTTKGNLTIHMQSDKHLANLQGYQGSGPTPTTPVPPLTAPPANTGQGEGGHTSPTDRQLKQKASWHCKVCNYETNISRNLRIHMTSEKHMQNVLLLHQGLGMGQDHFPFYGGPLAPEQAMEHPLLFNPMHFSSSGSQGCSPHTTDSPSVTQVSAIASSNMAIPAPPPLLDPSSSLPEEELSLGVFRCLVCRSFTTDSLEGLLSHASRGRSLPEREWREVRGDLHCCRLCSYSTQLKANFQLHLKTDKHAQKYQLAAHMREGGATLATAQASAAELPISGYSQASSFPPLHLRCNLCEYESNSREKIQMHVQGGGHEESLRVYKFLQSIEGLGGSDVCFHCAPCDSTVGTRLGMMSHLRSTSHHQNLAQWRLTHGEAVLERIVTVCRNKQEQGKVSKNTEVLSNQDPVEENKDKAQASTQDDTSSGGECEKAAEKTTVFCCPFCAYVSPSEEQVHSHAVSQHALQPTFRCPLCQEQLTGAANLRGHLGHGHNVVTECLEKLLQVAQKVNISFRTRIIPVRVIEEPDEADTDHQTSCEVTDASPPGSPGEISAGLFETVDSVTDTEKTPEETACPLCPVTSESPHDLRTHLEKDHPELSPSDIQQACDARAQEGDITEQEEKKEFQENMPAHPQQSTYRKTTNFAMDKFMDPSRPHKCVVCKESFTQKNILLVHYNSVSHLHKVRKASLDPSLSTRQESGVGPTGHGVQTGQDKPYKCTVCHVSYNQSSTLEIHMRSVLHQTRSRGSKQDPAKIPSEKAQKDPAIKSETMTDGREAAEAHGTDASKKRQQQLGSCMGVPILPTSVAPTPMQLSMDLSRPPPLVQPSPLFAPSLLPSFPLIPEALLKLQRQQQQLLLPFYLQELKISGDGSSLLSFGGAQQPPPIKDEGDQPSATPRPASEKDERIPDERDAATGETTASQNPDSSTKVSGDPTGSAARALLENFGFELVTQYNEGRQPITSQAPLQPRPPAPPPETMPIPPPVEKLQCGTCGKLFSNRLILKTHEEHMHQRLLPFEALSRYAANYRRSYDSHNPAGTDCETTESSATPLDFSVTSQVTHFSKEVEQPEAVTEHGITMEQLSFLHSLFDFPGPLLEEQILWAAGKTGLSPATIKHWFKQREKGIQEVQEEEEAEEALKSDRLGHRRFSRTKFSDFQTQALNSFFEFSAYPRDSEVEHLSDLLGLTGRVVVVWFQNARQKVRKQAAETGTSPSPPIHPNQLGERPAANSKVLPCRKCGVIIPCIFQLISHLKICYSEHTEEATEVEEKQEELDKTVKKDEAEKRSGVEPQLVNTQQKQEKEQDESLCEQDPTNTVTKGNADTPKINEENIQLSEQNDHPTDPKESSVSTCSVEQNQNKPLPSTSHISAPLMDLSLLIPVGSGEVGCQRKRKHEEESLSPTGSEGGDEPPRDKRLRTTILPEQLDILHRWYLQDSNPTRSILERISLEVGLKKRVVQVWFQNTRARERKGQYRGVAPANVSAPRQQEESVIEGSKRESSGYYYNVPSSQSVTQIVAKSVPTVQTTSSSVLSKPQGSSSLTTTPVTQSLVNPTQTLSGILSTAKVLPGLVNPVQAIPNLANSSQHLSGLVNTPQALSGLVTPSQPFSGIVSPAQVLSSLVSGSQTSQSLLLASFTAKPAAPPILLSSPPPESKLHSSPNQQVSQSSAGPTPEPDKTPIQSVPDIYKIATSEQKNTEIQTLENQGGTSKATEERGLNKSMDSLMHSPQGGDMSDSSSSDNGPTSPGKGALNCEGMMGTSGARRYRTQMSSLQLRILKACYFEYRTPSMQECDCLGSEIGLQKRVVQVWFQNARAKEKKAKLQGLVGTANEGPQPTECTHCNIKYGPTIPCRAHVFSRQHIARLRASIQQQLKEESRYRDTHPSAGAPPVSESKSTSQILNFQNPTTVTPQIQRLTPLLMPGQGIAAPIGGLATFNTGPTPSLIGMTSSVPPALLPRAAPPAPSSHTTNDTTKDSSQPAVTPETTVPSALKAASLMGAPFMPFSLAPAATPLFTPQIQGPYFQQLYGLKKRLFPINPVIPHTLLGLLPAPLKLAPGTTSPRKPEPSQTKSTSESRAEQGSTLAEEESTERDDDLDDEDIPMVDVAIRYQCQRCKTSYDEESEAEAHQRAECYTGPPPHPPPLRVRVCTYHCLSCQVLLQGPAARSQHLRSQQHRAQSACSDGASPAIPHLRPKSTATSVLMAL